MACAKLNVGNDGVQTSRVIYVLKRILSESFAEGWRSTAEQACGIVANFCYESTYCDPSAYRPNDNGGPSGGLMQWHERFSEAGFFSEMKNWVGQRNGGGWKSLPLQVDFFLKADTPQMKAERATWKKYCDENPGLSAESYAFAFMDKIERPAASERTETSESTKKRKGTASTLYEWLGSSDINDCDVSDIGKVAPSVIVMNGNSSASVRSRESMTAEQWEEFCRKCMEMKTNASLDATQALSDYTKDVTDELKGKVFMIGDEVWGVPIAEYIRSRNYRVDTSLVDGTPVNFATALDKLDKAKNLGAKHILFVSGEKEPFAAIDNSDLKCVSVPSLTPNNTENIWSMPRERWPLPWEQCRAEESKKNWESTLYMEYYFEKIVQKFSHCCRTLGFKNVGVMMVPPIDWKKPKIVVDGDCYINKFNRRLFSHFSGASRPPSATQYRQLPLLPKDQQSELYSIYNKTIDLFFEYCQYLGWCAHKRPTKSSKELMDAVAKISEILVESWNYSFVEKIV